MSEVIVKLLRSPIGRVPKHRRTLLALGLRKINQCVTHKATPQLRGMIKQVEYMVAVQEAGEKEA